MSIRNFFVEDFIEARRIPLAGSGFQRIPLPVYAKGTPVAIVVSRDVHNTITIGTHTTQVEVPLIDQDQLGRLQGRPVEDLMMRLIAQVANNQHAPEYPEETLNSMIKEGDGLLINSTMAGLFDPARAVMVPSWSATSPAVRILGGFAGIYVKTEDGRAGLVVFSECIQSCTIQLKQKSRYARLSSATE